ncbi:quinolone resistance protein [Thermococcus siculi]|uniref:Quinolone resistance protein n=1 Tax=Thermococcus siculi TaxID=72803 RepID=A0A2Z2MUC6_9EURY|nr:MFS transporter [Thermococcus siculi]ASJ07763.1 quinolone resistance protein [Thermococcus siculi]
MSATREIWYLHFATFFFFLGIALVGPLISPFSISLGADPFLVGLIAAVSAVVALLTKPLGGYLGDKGFRFHLMLAGTVLGVIAGILYVLSHHTSNLWLFALGRGLHGFAMGIFFPPNLSTAIDLAPEGRVGETLGWRGTMFSLGNLIGPALGGYIADFSGFTVAFATAAGLSAVAALLVLNAYRHVGKHLPARGYHREEPNYRLLLRPFFVFASLGLLFMSLSYSGLNTFLPALYKVSGLGTAAFGTYASIMGGSSLITRVIGGKQADLRGPVKIATLGLALITASYVLLNALPFPPGSYASALVIGAGFGLAVPSLQMMALASLPQRIRSFGSGIYTMFFDLGFLVGPMLLGYIAKLHGYRAVFPILPWLALAALFLIQFPRFLRAGGERSG